MRLPPVRGELTPYSVSAQSWLTAFLQWRSVTDAIPRAVKEAASGENVPGAHVLTSLLQKRVVQQMGPQPLDYAKAALTEGVPFAQATIPFFLDCTPPQELV